MISFKQFLIEQDLPDWSDRFHRHTPEEIAKMPQMNGGNIEGKFKVGDIVIDNERGVGAVPFNQEVVYKGFVAMMMPQVFTQFTSRMEDSQDRVLTNVKIMRAGIGVGCPWLWIDFTGEKSQKTGMFYVRGHEGRARTKAMAILQPNVPIPVHVIAYGGNAKNITPEVITHLNDSIVKQDTELTVVHNRILSIWLKGSHISLK